VKEPKTQAEAVVIWMHGLGADSRDMMGLVEELSVHHLPVRHVFIDAPHRPVTINAGMMMPAWYDILGMQLTDREDKAGIEQSASLIGQVVAAQLKTGLKEHDVFLAGFSQGGAMAIHTALHMPVRLGGVIALSAYLPMATNAQAALEQSTPIFMAAGSFDPVVLPIWTKQSREWLSIHGYQHIDFHEYPMEHSICHEEVNDISTWLERHVRGALS
jgi:phospholipase/carboxylesterase